MFGGFNDPLGRGLSEFGIDGAFHTHHPFFVGSPAGFQVICDCPKGISGCFIGFDKWPCVA
jgi:hypothetical protein